MKDMVYQWIGGKDLKNFTDGERRDRLVLLNRMDVGGGTSAFAIRSIG